MLQNIAEMAFRVSISISTESITIRKQNTMAQTVLDVQF